MFDKDCAMCCYMGTCENNDGKFPCTSPKVSAKYVSANQNASDCNSYTPSFSSRRGESEMERLRKISRNKGYYIMTAIMDILNIPEKDIYIAEFAYIKDVVMPNLEGGNDWILEYDVIGLDIAFGLREDINRVEIAKGLFEKHIKGFHELFQEGKIDEAITAYDQMYCELKRKYGFEESPRKLIQTIPKGE